MIKGGDIVISPTNGEERVVVDVADYREEEDSDSLDNVILVLRYPAGHPDRVWEVGDNGPADKYLFSEKASEVTETGRSIYDSVG